MEEYQLHIPHAQSTGDFLEIKTPFDGTPVARIERADKAAIEQAMTNAVTVYNETLSMTPAYKRADVLRKVSQLIEQKEEELAMTIAKEGGKPYKDALAEVRRAAITVRTCAEEALRIQGDQISMDRSAAAPEHLAFTIRQSIGPVLAVCAFNHPVNLIAHQVGTAYAAGNTVLVKPASQTPISALKIAQLFAEAGVEEGAINVLTISGRDTDVLVSDERVKFVSFIGGADVGWNIAKKVHPGTRYALEHGGTGTSLVDPSANLSLTIPKIVKGAFYHAGQVCVSTQIVYAHSSIYDDVKRMLVEEIGTLQTGDPTSADTDVGPLISHKDHERILSWIEQAKQGGATVETGGNALTDSCIAPTLLTGVMHDMDVYAKEIFGPVLVLLSYDNQDTVIEAMNATPFSFQASIYAEHTSNALDFAKRIHCKGVMVNDHTAFRVDWMPFGGAKSSGHGWGGVRYSILDQTEEKLIVLGKGERSQ